MTMLGDPELLDQEQCYCSESQYVDFASIGGFGFEATRSGYADKFQTNLHERRIKGRQGTAEFIDQFASEVTRGLGTAPGWHQSANRRCY